MSALADCIQGNGASFVCRFCLLTRARAKNEQCIVWWFEGGVVVTYTRSGATKTNRKFCEYTERERRETKRARPEFCNLNSSDVRDVPKDLTRMF